MGIAALILLYFQLGDYINEPEPEPSIIEGISDWIPDNITIPTPEWKNIDKDKVAQILVGILGILGLGWLVKFLSEKMIDTSKSIKFLDYTTSAQYHMDSEGNWSIGCPTGDAVPASNKNTGSSTFSREPTTRSKSILNTASSISKISSVKK